MNTYLPCPETFKIIVLTPAYLATAANSYTQTPFVLNNLASTRKLCER